jgi:GcrA cell cycle regulator
MRQMKNAWTEQDNERLKAMVAAGASPVRAAAAFGRSIVSVRVQARKLGSPFPARRPKRLDSETRV